MTRTAIITGASRGLGAALAARFWANGYSLVLIARGRAGLERTRAGLPAASAQTCEVVPCDLGDADAVDSLVSGLHKRLNRADVLVNNAAIHGPIGPAWDCDLAAWRHVLQVNLLAPVALCRGVVALMRETGGSIVNLSGGGATAARPRFAAYAASKAALVRFSETLAEEAKPMSVRVNSVSPGAMRTSLLEEIVRNPEASGALEVAKVLEADRDVEDSFARVSQLVLFLASDASRHITGKVISAVWDCWEQWPEHAEQLATSDVYTLRRIVGRDRGMTWGDR